VAYIPAGTSLHEVLEKPLADVADRAFLAAVPINSSCRIREDICNLAFEFGASSAFVASTSFLAALGAGLSTAIVLDIGESGACAVPVEEGHPFAQCATRSGVGGQALNDCMAHLLQRGGCDVPSGMEATLGRAAKEQLGYVAADFSAEQRKLREGILVPSSCEALDGSFLARSGEGFVCAELLFNPSLSVSTTSLLGIPELVMNTLRLQSDINLRGRLLENILLVGGSSKFTGLPERLLSEIRSRSAWVAPGKRTEDVCVRVSEDQICCAWQGGAALVECDVFKQFSITRAQFVDEGAAAIHRTFL